LTPSYCLSTPAGHFGWLRVAAVCGIVILGTTAPEFGLCQSGAGAKPSAPTPLEPDHEPRSPLQTELAEAMGHYPPDREQILGLVRKARGSLNFSLRGRCGDTPLVYAARRADVELIRALLDNGVRIDDRLTAPPGEESARENRSCPSYSALMGSVGFGDEIEAAARNARLEALGSTELAKQLKEMHDPEQHLKVTRFVLDRGANVNLKAGREGDTAVVVALRGHHRSAAKLLYERGASADVRSPMDDSGRSSDLLVILQSNDWSVLSLTLEDAIRKPDVAIQASDLELAKLALSHGASQTDKDRVLQAALAVHQQAVAGLLLQFGANSNLHTRLGQYGLVSPLSQTIEGRRWDDASMLLRGGASPKGCVRENSPGQCDTSLVPSFLPSTRLFTSAMLLGAPTPLLRLMLDKGADINATDQTGRTPLESANGQCIRDGRVFSGSRCPPSMDPPEGFDREAMSRFLLDNGARPRADLGATGPTNGSAAPPATATSAAAATPEVGSGRRFRAAVLDVATQQPIPGAFVVVDWTATASGLESREVCLHTDAARTDPSGQYEMDDWSGYPFPLYDRTRRVRAFKFGYEVASVQGQTVYMRAIAPSGDRWRVVEPCLINYGKDKTAEFRKTRRHFYGLYATMAKDLAPAADSDPRKTVLERLGQKAESCLVDYSKPVMMNRYGLDANVDPNDGYALPVE
jgi:ankyrin repeat protein